MIDAALRAVLNELLSGEDWARERLSGFAGQVALIAWGPVQARLMPTERGLLAIPDCAHDPDVVITLPQNLLAILPQGLDAVSRNIRFEGRADFAEALAFLAQHLRWDSSDATVGRFGDVPSMRVVNALQGLMTTATSGLNRGASALAEYAQTDGGFLPMSQELVTFGEDVERQRDYLARLEKRATRLDRRLE